MSKKTISAEAIQNGEKLFAIGHRGARAAQEENRRLDIPSVYSINGVI